MRVRDALRQAWRVWKAQPAQLFGFLLIEIVLRLMVLTPLLALADPATAPAALLSVPLFFLIVPPARACAAEVMQRAIGDGGGLFDRGLVLCGDYGRKVLEGLKQGLLLLLWAVPLTAFAAEAAVLWSGQTGGGGTDGLTLLRSVIVSTFGGGDLVRGLVMTAALFALCALIAVFGLAFHSGRRHELALGGRVPKGQRAGVLRCWLMGLLTALPFLLAGLLLARDWLHSLIGAIRSSSGSFTMLPPRTLILLGLAFLILRVPLIPLKSLITACYVRAAEEQP